MVAREPSAGLKAVIRDASRKSGVGGSVEMMRTRRDEFPTQIACDLAGLYMDPVTRDYVRQRLRETWSASSGVAVTPGREHVVGGGLHAAVWAGTRARLGMPEPVVWEMNVPGFASCNGTGKPAFWLQSRNRPGPPGTPERGNLNHIPGAVVQPSHLATGEYPDDSMVSWCVETTLAAYADVRKDTVTDVQPSGMALTALEAGRVLPRRVIFATGMGTDSEIPLIDRERRRHVLTFHEFMDRMGGPFPLRGVRRATVVGGGPSGRAAVMSLLGMAPAGHWSVPELDWVREVDWYAVGIPATREGWLESEPRGQSLEISRFLPRSEEDDAGEYQPARKSESRRLRVLGRRAYPVEGLDSATIELQGYDLAVVCAGLTRREGRMRSLSDPSQWGAYGPAGGVTIARKYSNADVYAVGPAARLPSLSEEAVQALIGEIPGNLESIFRLAPKTAQLAMTLPA